MQKNSVAVVILNWNTRDYLARFLPSVIKNSRLPEVEIIVADNGSTDGSVEYVQTHFPEVRIIGFNKNYGFAGGYNCALKQIKATYSVLLNSDVEPGEKWLDAMIECMNKRPDIAACVPKIKHLKMKNMFEYAGAAGGFIDKWGYTFCRGRIFNRVEEDLQQYNTSGDIFWGSGAALMVRTDLFNESDGLDEHFFAHMEEIDWCWRMKNRGLKIWYVAQSEVYHLGGGTLNALSPRKTYLNFRNNLFLLYRNLPHAHFKRRIFIRLILDGIAGLKSLITGQWQFFRAIFMAHRDYFQSITRLRHERELLKKETIQEKHPEIYPKSIVIEFFLKRKKRFSELTKKNDSKLNVKFTKHL
jgi:GT2 family glycosyltransferase